MAAKQRPQSGRRRQAARLGSEGQAAQIAMLADQVGQLARDLQIQIMRTAQMQQQIDRLAASTPETDRGPGDRAGRRERPS